MTKNDKARLKQALYALFDADHALLALEIDRSKAAHRGGDWQTPFAHSEVIEAVREDLDRAHHALRRLIGKDWPEDVPAALPACEFDHDKLPF